MDGLHWPDVLVLIAFGVLIFGPKRLPEMGAALGKALRAFRAAIRDDGEPAPRDSDTVTQRPAPANARPVPVTSALSAALKDVAVTTPTGEAAVTQNDATAS